MDIGTSEFENLLLRVLDSFSSVYPNNVPWMERYEFYKANDTVGFCYVGETSSIRLANTRNKQCKKLCNKNYIPQSTNTQIRKKTSNECSTIDLKELLNPQKNFKNKTDYSKNESVRSVKRKPSTIVMSNIIAECTQPTDPEEQLRFLQQKFSNIESYSNTDNLSHIKLLEKELNKDFIQKYLEKIFDFLKQRRDMRKYKKYFQQLGYMFLELTITYKKSVQKSFLDYALSDPENMKILKLYNYQPSYPTFHIRSPVSWHQNVVNGKNFMRHNLFITHPLLIKLRNLWFEKYENKHFIDNNTFAHLLPFEYESLQRTISELSQKMKTLLLTKWIPECLRILNAEKENEYMKTLEKQQMKKCFEAVYSLMSLQLRKCVDNCVYSFYKVISQFQTGNNFSGDYEDYEFVQPTFLIIRLKPLKDKPFVCFSPTFEEIENLFQNLFKTILNIGELVPRMESLLFVGSQCLNEYLLSPRITENYIQKVIQTTLKYCENNFSGPQKYIKFYDPYVNIFKRIEETKLEETFHKQLLPAAMKNFVDKMEEFILLKQRVTTFRQDVPLNMMNLKCDEFNTAILNRIGYLQQIITDYFLNDGTIHNESVISRFEEIARKSSETPESTKALVDLQNFIYNSKIEVSSASKKELVKSADYLIFLLCYTEVSENVIAINSKVFRWPTHLEQILESASQRVSQMIEIVENNLKIKTFNFNEALLERQQQLDSIRKKDPPVLAINEVKDIVSQIDQFTTTLKEDTQMANDINTEEELLNIGTTSYCTLFNIISALDPFSELWHTVLDFHESYDLWCHCPFKNIDASLVKESVHKMKHILNKLSKCFHDAPGAERIVEIVLTKVEKYSVNIPILETICNPGIQDRHWKKINDAIGMTIAVTAETTFSEILNYGVNKYIDLFQEINVSATKEFALENSALKMKDEWNSISIKHESCRDTGMLVLTGIDDIQIMLDDYLLRIQTMRGSPYIGAIEADIEAWENKLIMMQDILDLWLQVQSTWLHLEPLFDSEDIMRQMPEESDLFNEVNRIWNGIMTYAIQNPEILVIIEYPNLVNTLEQCNATLEGIKKGLNEYLEKKRLVFPRFFFLSNHELLEILSESKNFSKIQSHLKCFEGISSLDMTENYDIIGIISAAGEVVPLNNAISPVEAKGIVERWLDQLEDSMIQTLCDINNKSVRSFSTTPLIEWIFMWPAMISYCALYTIWTTDMETSMKTDQISKCVYKYDDIMHQLIQHGESDLNYRDRSTLSTLVTLLIYLRNTSKILDENNVRSPASVQWIKHLRYYNEEQTTHVRMLQSVLFYGYEYLGNFNRLIITPETEHSYRLMSSCVSQNLFACLMDSPEAGKTEMCKDFSRVVAKPYCSFKCCPKVGYKVLSTFLKGCVQMGAWVCFDGIDNMRCEELAIVAEEIRSIQTAISEKTNRFKFENVEVPLNLTCNIIFIFDKKENFNIELPCNLRRVLRPIMLSQQNYLPIIERSLMSYGFKNSSRLSRKIFELHELFSKLSFQNHHKSTLRSLSKVMQCLKNMKFSSNEKDECEMVVRAIQMIYSYKFTGENLQFFNEACQTITEKALPKENDNATLVNNIEFILNERKLIASKALTDKIIQIFKSLEMKQNVIILGPSFVGKSQALQVVLDLVKQSSKNGNLRFSILNPSSVTHEQLYGCLDSETGEWTDGILTKIYREYSSNSESTRKFLILDGPMHYTWTDRLVTALDESKKMSLISGEIMERSEEMNFIFETDSLDFVSPSLPHCCSIVLFGPQIITWRCLLSTFLNTLKETLLKEQIDIMKNLVEWLVSSVLNFLKENAEAKLPYNEQYMFQQFTKLTWNILKSDGGEFGVSNAWLQAVILVSIVWSFVGGATDKDKILFDAYFRNVLLGQNDQFPVPEQLKSMKPLQFPEKYSIWDWICLKQGSEVWNLWTQSIGSNRWSNEKSEEMFVLTKENAQQIYFMDLFLKNQEPFLVMGPASNGKTKSLRNFIFHLPSEKYIVNLINFSRSVTANRVQEKVMAKIDRRRKGVYGPTVGKKIILTFDDFEAAKRSLPSENVIELLRQLLEYKCWFDLEDFCRIDLIDFIFVGTVTQNLSDFVHISPRFIHHVNLIYTKAIEEPSISTIFTTLLNNHFRKNGFSDQVQRQSQVIVNATFEIYKTAKKLLESHNYKMPTNFIDMKDLSRIFSGIKLMNGQFCQGVDELYRHWAHEIFRVLADKFPCKKHKEQILDVLKSASCRHLRQRMEQYMSHLIPDEKHTLSVEDLRKLCFTSLPINKTEEYDEVTNIDSLIEGMGHFADQYNLKYKTQFPCLIFQFVVECLCIVVHALNKDEGNVLLIGASGSGGRTVLRLTAIVLGLDLFEANITSEYSVENWKTNLKEILWKAGAQNNKQFLLLYPTQMNDAKMFDDMNTLVSTADLIDIYSTEERCNILNTMMEIVHEEQIKFDAASTTLLNLFTQRVKRNLHVAVVMNPSDSRFYDILRECPGLLKSCSVYWYPSWPNDALKSVAVEFLKENAIFKDNNFLNKCVDFCKTIHNNARKITHERRFNESLSQKMYVTSKTYIQFLSTFQILYEDKVQIISEKRNRYVKGLEILNFTAKQVTNMQAELQILKPKLLTTSNTTEKLMGKIEQNTVMMEATKEIVAADEALANEAAAAAQAIRDDCESDLSEAEPALISATNALNTLKCFDITVIKAMKNPPSIVKLVLESVCIMKSMKPECRTDVAGNSIEDFWPTSLKLLSDTKFLESLKNYDKENIDAEIMSIIRGRFIPHPDFDPDVVKKVSNACEGLCKWVRALEIYDRVIKIVRPKKLKLTKAEAAYSSQMEKMNEKRTQLTEVMSKLQCLQDEWAEKTKQKKELEDEIKNCTSKLKRADKLLESLQNEGHRWYELESELKKDLIRSIGDVFLSSAFITYLSIFPPNFRSEMIKKWHEICCEIELPVTHNYSFSSTFICKDDIKFWSMAGFPTDSVSVDNYVLLLKTTRIPLVIDPQGQAKEFIKHFERSNDVCALKASDKNILENLTKAIVKSQAILIEEILDKPDDIIMSLINRRIEIVKNTSYLKIKDRNVIFYKLPKIYLSTIYLNEHLSSLYNFVTLINFEITPEQLNHRLLKMIILVDAPDLEIKRNNLLLKCAEDCQSLYETEDKIFSVLSSTTMNILEDETAIQTLNDAKNLMEEIRLKQQNSITLEENLKVAYAPYKEISRPIAYVYFALAKLHHLNCFYLFSFDWFTSLFDQTVKKSEKYEDLTQRVSRIKKLFMNNLHKELDQMFCGNFFLISNFFIAIETFIEQHNIQNRTLFSDNLWSTTFTLDEHSVLIDDSKSNLEIIFDEYSLAIMELNKLMVHLEKEQIIPKKLLESLKTEKFMSSIEDFINFHFQKVDESLDLYEIYHGSDDRVPIICGFTSTDIDPIVDILSLVSEIGLPEETIQCLSVTKTKLNVLDNIVDECLTQGKWLVIQDFHLLKNVFCDLISLLNRVNNTSEVHPQFKLWILTYPVEDIPITILLNATKLMMRENTSLSAILHQLYSYSFLHMSHIFENQKSKKYWNFLFFLICFCHAVLKIIQKLYVFTRDTASELTMLNFRLSTSFLEILTREDQEESSFLEDFKYVLNECNYQAHFSNEIDRISLKEIVNSLSIEKSEKPSHMTIMNCEFEIPEELSFNASVRYIQSLPMSNLLEHFKLYHFSVADRIQTVINFWKCIRKLYCVGRPDRNYINYIIEDVLILQNIVENFAKYRLSPKDPMNFYIKQEMQLYEKLIFNIFESLKSLENAVTFQMQLSKQDKSMLDSLQTNEVPDAWSSWSYPFSSTLKTYLTNLNQRVSMITKWSHYGHPIVIWLPGLFNVLSYFTMMRLNFGRYHRVPLMEVDLKFFITKFQKSEVNSNEWTRFYKGIILIGGQLNVQTGHVEEATDDSYSSSLPIVWIEPELHRENEACNHFSCPLYYVFKTTNEVNLNFRIQNFIINFNLPTSFASARLTQNAVKLILET